MHDEELRVQDDPRTEDVAHLGDRLYEFNAAATGVDDGRWLSVFVRDAGGQLEAGLHGWTWGGTCHVEILWVREDLRRRGLGARLLARAEREAIQRGCRLIDLATHSYQAPGFYRRLGYQVYAELPGWPGDTTRLFLRKTLVPGGAAASPPSGA
jgi:ribosomal protein S18 acetylase RimI-like enzyme